MIKNYFKIAFRNLWRHRGFSLINVFGLSMGLTVFMLILMYVKYELSFDNFHRNSDRIYRLNVDAKSGSQVVKTAMSSAPMGPALKVDFPEVEDYTRISTGSVVVRAEKKLFRENRCFVVDPGFFKIFSFSIIEGNAADLVKPFTVILNEITARKYFGSEKAVGKIIEIEGGQQFMVVGIAKNVPTNSQFKFDVAYSFPSREIWVPGSMTHWDEPGNYTFLLLKPGVSPSRLESRLPAFLIRHIDEKTRLSTANYHLSLEKLKDLYLDERGGIERGSSSDLTIFTIIALFILSIAAVNFINLTTARSSERAKEVGIRKVVGAARNQLTGQFLGESFLISLIAFLFSVGLVSLLLPLFNQFSGKVVAYTIFQHNNIVSLFLISIVIGLIAGIYPALAISSFRPVSILKGRFSSSDKGNFLRKGLVIFQFTISIILIIGTMVVYYQLRFMQRQPLGFDKNQLVKVDFGFDLGVEANFQSIEEQFKSIPGVSGVSLSIGVPGEDNPLFVEPGTFENARGITQSLNEVTYDIDYNFLSIYGMKIIAGRGYTQDFPRDSTASIVVNEATVRSLGYTSPAQVIGKHFTHGTNSNMFKGMVIGVVKDFHSRSLAKSVQPMALVLFPKVGTEFTFKISAWNMPATLAAIQKKFQILLPEKPFEYSFLDQDLNQQYVSEAKFGELFFCFALFAVCISCLGLLGLASYNILQRTKEIGIRKVLGASVTRIINMLSQEFLQLVLISSVIAFPLAWYGMRKWLDGFAIRVDLSWWIFAIAGILALFVAFATVSLQATKAALTNPIKSLKAE